MASLIDTCRDRNQSSEWRPQQSVGGVLWRLMRAATRRVALSTERVRPKIERIDAHTDELSKRVRHSLVRVASRDSPRAVLDHGIGNDAG